MVIQLNENNAYKKLILYDIYHPDNKVNLEDVYPVS